MTTQTVTNAVAEVQAVADEILDIIEAADPAVALPATAAATLLNLLADMATKALSALTTAQGEAINAGTIASTLTPNPTPLTPPTI